MMLQNVKWWWIFLVLKALNYVSGQMLLFATSKDIRIANLSRPLKPVTLIKDLEEGAAIDYYYKKSLVCWTDHGTEMISCCTFDGNHIGNRHNVITNGLITPDGLAIDWVTEKLYWTDSETNKLEVSSLDGSKRKVLYWDDIDQPRAIALVPQESIMFWTDWGEVPKIEKGAMNGDPRHRKVIVDSTIFWPNGIAIDFTSRLLYWIDGRLTFIEVMDYDGRNRRKIAEKEILYPFALSMFRDKLYWTDWKTWSIHVFDKRANQSARELLHVDLVPMDLRVWDSSRQPEHPNPCAQNNGGCSDLCLLAPYEPGYTCACPTGVRLLNNVTCANGSQEMLLLVQRTDICKISLDTPDHTNVMLPVVGVKHAIAIDYDPVGEHLYWTDDEARTIRRIKLDGTGQQDVITIEVEHPDGVAVDWVARNLYWTDTGTDRIEVSRLDGAHRKVLVNTDLVEPRAIALSPGHGFLFWSDWNEKRPKIERSMLSGGERVVLVKEKLGWPNGVTLDVENEKLYWCDAKTDKIEMIDFDGGNRRELINENLPHVFGISLLGDYVYWTDWQRRSIDRVNKVTGNDREIIIEPLANIMGLKGIGHSVPNVTNPCAAPHNGNCSHLCFYLGPGNGHKCACAIGYELSSADLVTCFVPEAFLVMSRSDSILRGSTENDVNNALIPLQNVREIRSIDAWIGRNEIYWADAKVRTIGRAHINGSNYERLVDYGIQSVESVCVDWIAGNLYWSDTFYKRIEVTRLAPHARYRRVLIWNNLYEPRSICVVPALGLMLWSDWSAGNAGTIERSALDGTARSVLTHKVKANSLTVNYDEKRVYYVNLLLSSIESMDFEGKNKVVLVANIEDKPVTLTLYRNEIFYSNWDKKTIEKIDKSSRTRSLIYKQSDKEINDMLIYHPSRQVGWNKCSLSNNECPYLCLVSPNPRGGLSYRCECPTHYTMVNGTCTPPTSYLIYAQRNILSRLVTDPAQCPDSPYEIPNVKNIKALDFDPLGRQIYWIDSKLQAIKRASENGSSVEIFYNTNTYTTFQILFDLVVDAYNGILFYTCANTNAIYGIKMSNKSEQYIVYKGGEGVKPRHLALHQDRGLLFWSDLNEKHNIVRCRIDGAKKLIIAGDLLHVTSVTVDTELHNVYFSYNGIVEMTDLNGNNRQVLIKTNLKHVMSLTVHGPNLVYLDREEQIIESVHKLNASNRHIVLSHVPHLIDIVHAGPVNVQHVCYQSPCSHYCLAVDGQVQCACPHELNLHDNLKSCLKQESCTPDKFKCASGECIPSVWHCDNQPDCIDSSDETDCVAKCDISEFRCLSGGQCIDSKLRCDGVPQCTDASDEQSCCSQTASFVCTSGQCIRTSLICDGIPHCTDGTDEAGTACELSPQNHHLDPYDEMSASSLNLITSLVVFIVLFSFVMFLYYNFRYKKSLSPPPTTNIALSNQPLRHVLPPPPRLSSLPPSSSSSYHHAQSSTSLLCYPLNPPPSPATTIQREEYCCPRYQPPPPTPCSTDVCDESDCNYNDPYPPPPPSPTSHSELNSSSEGGSLGSHSSDDGYS
uniref:Low-density lipoprotein receptor-related protein 6 n=2 Tax=Cacopsylla melanoneura TaxID=428564 RepID=A0A8D8WXU2_9HEMI